MVLLASYVLVALAVAEADPQFGGVGNIHNGALNFNSRIRNSESSSAARTDALHAPPIALVTRPQEVCISDNLNPIIESSAVVSGGLTFTVHTTSVSNVQIPKVQPEDTCDTGCKCTEIGGFCIPEGQDCTNPAPKQSGYCKAKPSNKRCTCCLKPTVYMQDIVNTIIFFLTEIAPHTSVKVFRNFKQVELTALSNIIEAFVQHLPLEYSLKRFLNCVGGHLQRSNRRRRFTGQSLLRIVGSCTSTGELPTIPKWVGCRNYVKSSDQAFRSYPCGVWTTFHAITVHIANGQQPQQDVLTILQTLKHMVEYFPWCGMCRKDFLHMYGNDFGKAKNMDTAEKVVMWLWKGHNKVTARTLRKKSNLGRSQWQFPGVNQCPGCQSPQAQQPQCKFPQSWQDLQCFNDAQVYGYLKKIYTPPFQ